MALFLRNKNQSEAYETFVPCRPISHANILKLFHRIISRNVLEHVSVFPTFLVNFQGSDLTGTHGMQVSRENGFQHRSIRDVTLVWSQWESETWVTPGSLVANYSVWMWAKCYLTGKTNTSQSNLVRYMWYLCSEFEPCTVCFKDSISLKWVIAVGSFCMNELCLWDATWSFFSSVKTFLQSYALNGH